MTLKSIVRRIGNERRYWGRPTLDDQIANHCPCGGRNWCGWRYHRHQQYRAWSRP